MKTHHTSLYHSIDNPKLSNVFKQELVTWERTEFGLQISRIERSFDTDRHSDNHISTPLPSLSYQG